MSTDTVVLQRRLLTQNWVDRSMNELIPNIRDAAEKAKIGDRDCELIPAQMSNLVGVAGDTRSVQVVISYIQYQVGRDSKNRKSWAWHGFGETLVKELNGLQERAKGIVGSVGKEVQAPLQSDAFKAEVDRVWMELTRHYLGHLRRYFMYRKPERGGSR